MTSNSVSTSDPPSEIKGKRVSYQTSWSTDKSPSLSSEYSNFSYPSSMRLSHLPPLKSDNEDDDDLESSVQSPRSDSMRLSNARIRQISGSTTSGIEYLDPSNPIILQATYVPDIPRKSSKRISLPTSHYNDFRPYSRTEPSLIVRPGSVSAIVQDIETSDGWG